MGQSIGIRDHCSQARVRAGYVRIVFLYISMVGLVTSRKAEFENR